MFVLILCYKGPCISRSWLKQNSPDVMLHGLGRVRSMFYKGFTLIVMPKMVLTLCIISTKDLKNSCKGSCTPPYSIRHCACGIQWMKSSLLWMRSSLVVRASDCQWRSHNSPGFYPSILRHSGIWGVADEELLNTVHRKKSKTIPLLVFSLAKKVPSSPSR